MIINSTRVMPIFTSFVCHWNYPELTYYKPTAAPAMHSTETRGKHIKKKKPQARSHKICQLLIQ